MLPETDGLAASLLAKRLLKSIRAAGGNGLPKVTATIGLATYPLESNDSAELISLADQRLYEGKRGGRDRVIEAGGLTGEAEL